MKFATILMVGAVACTSRSAQQPSTTPPATVASSVPAPSAAPDTGHVDLSHLHTAIPPSAVETGGPAIAQPHRQIVAPSVGYPAAPEPVRRAVTREQGISQFCFQEFGEKTDPSLEGAVAVVVTVASGTISGAHVASANWTDDHLGAQVDRCLNDRIAQAWRLASEDSARVAAGHYVVYLGFRRS